MPLFKLRIAVADLATGERAVGALGAADAPVPAAVTLFEDGAAFSVEAYYDAAPDLAAVAGVLGRLGAGLGPPALEPVPDENWVALSQAALAPVRAGGFLVHGSHDRARIGLRRLALEIEAGEAFGTGHGATTALCLEAIGRLRRTGCPFARILDLGCGSGILAIAAARAWPRAYVLAVDDDPVAAAVARENVRLNRVDRRVRVLEAAGFAHRLLRAPGAFDLVLANLLPGSLIGLAPAVRRGLAQGGVAVLSGLLDRPVREVRGIYLAAGFCCLRALSREGWSALALRRVQTAARATPPMAPPRVCG